MWEWLKLGKLQAAGDATEMAVASTRKRAGIFMVAYLIGILLDAG
jgi:hypothetical protein